VVVAETLAVASRSSPEPCRDSPARGDCRLGDRYGERIRRADARWSQRAGFGVPRGAGAYRTTRQNDIESACLASAERHVSVRGPEPISAGCKVGGRGELRGEAWSPGDLPTMRFRIGDIPGVAAPLSLIGCGYLMSSRRNCRCPDFIYGFSRRNVD
jgi:hypothetical protein